MPDLSRYQILAGVILCKDCPKGSTKKVVATFDNTSHVSFDEMNTEIAIHEGSHHEATFEDTASETGRTLRRTAQELKARAEAAQKEGVASDMAALLGSDVALILAQCLREVSEMDSHYEELIQDHNRKTCDDFTCFVFGYLVDIARAIDKQIG